MYKIQICNTIICICVRKNSAHIAISNEIHIYNEEYVDEKYMRLHMCFLTMPTCCVTTPPEVMLYLFYYITMLHVCVCTHVCCVHTLCTHAHMLTHSLTSFKLYLRVHAGVRVSQVCLCACVYVSII